MRDCLYVYNDVVVSDGWGDFKIYGYPRDVFPPTYCHTATLVDDWIYIIGGNIDHWVDPSDTIVGEIPSVYRLNCNTCKIEKVITSGESPSWISYHSAILRDLKIYISGGLVWSIAQKKFTRINNEANYILDLERLYWHRVET